MVGSHLLERLLSDKHSVLATYFRPTMNMRDIEHLSDLVELDVRYALPVRDLIERTMPDEIYHLAAQSLPTLSWQRPQETFEVNATGTINVMEGVKNARKLHPGYDPVIVVACSSAQYGASLTPENVPIKESAEFLPLHPYGVSKVAQDLLTYQYFRCDGIRGIRARIFNSTGPRKRDDVVSDFCKRTARIMRDGGALRVGNLATRRAILDVRDLVSALLLLGEKGEAGEAYNICAEQTYLIADLVKELSAISKLDLMTEVDPALLRPSDEPIIFGDNTRLKKRTGWCPKISISQTLRDVLDYEIKALSASN